MIDYVKNLPEYISMSQYLKEKADGYIKVSLNGKKYYVPLTKEIKKRFHIKRMGNKINFSDFKEETALSDMINMIGSSLYLQTRDTVGSEIREEITNIVQDKIANLFNPQVEKEIDLRFEAKDKLLKDKNEETT